MLLFVFGVQEVSEINLLSFASRVGNMRHRTERNPLDVCLQGSFAGLWGYFLDSSRKLNFCTILMCDFPHSLGWLSRHEMGSCQSHVHEAKDGAFPFGSSPG